MSIAPTFAELSDAANEVLAIAPEHAYTQLIVQATGPAMAKQLLEGLKPFNATEPPSSDAHAASTVLCGLWLWHDFLEQAHVLCQDLETPEGAWWHAILHRREGDFSNAKYWYRRVGDHVVMDAIGERIGDLFRNTAADAALLKVVHDGFDPMAYVDLVQKLHATPGPSHDFTINVQRLEWHGLMQHCLRQATAE